MPFWIIHVDLWLPGLTENSNGNKLYLMNCMCDLTQFFISSVTASIDAGTLAEIFMADVVLSFGMYFVVVIDYGSTFKSVFISMCKSLSIHYWCLSRGNHRGNSVKHYHRFLNQTEAIAGNDRGTHLVIIQNAKISQYAWNSAPIDGTDIPRSTAAIGRGFLFPLDVDLVPTPTLNDHNSKLFSYLRNVSIDANFAVSVLHIIIGDRHTTH